MTTTSLPPLTTPSVRTRPAVRSRPARGGRRGTAPWDPDAYASAPTASLTVLVAGCAHLLEGFEVGAAAVDADHVLDAVAGSCDRALDLASFQAEHVEGPLVEAFLGDEVLLDQDVLATRHLWPRFAAVAAAVGYHTVHAFPLTANGANVGALMLAETGRHALHLVELETVQALADTAAVALLQELAHLHWEERSRQLQYALDSRVLVEQAKGALAERIGTTPERAFELIRTFARSHNVHIDDVARSVVAGALTLVA